MADFTSDPIQIINPRGLHARASAALARTAGEARVDITISKGADSALATSLLDLLMLGASMGDYVTVSADGADAASQCQPVIDLISRGFDEI